MNDMTRFHITYDPPFGGYSIHITSKLPGDNKYSIATDIKFGEIENGYCYQPVMRLDRGEALSLMNELWNAGIRPDGIGDNSHLKTLLDDVIYLRSVVDRLLIGR